MEVEPQSQDYLRRELCDNGLSPLKEECSSHCSTKHFSISQMTVSRVNPYAAEECVCNVKFKAEEMSLHHIKTEVKCEGVLSHGEDSQQ
ncbi:Teneurin-m [Frankliniella fusca]|uniref:Teneurin-m n=1 Tax=Frankliniella fusca TaxID=407009 RepID=A0AAE1LGS5_9NEOP|nr:Teneurin-m [Frankliniella fusca]